MSATRTQVYLTDEQRRRIDELSESEGLSLAEIVRRALDHYLDASVPDAGQSLTATFGAIPDMVGPDRSEWDRD